MNHRLLAGFLFLGGWAQGQTLTGVIDFHVHSDPDSVARSIDAIDLAKLAKSRGVLDDRARGQASGSAVYRDHSRPHRSRADEPGPDPRGKPGSVPTLSSSTVA